MTTRIKLRRDTAANWTSANPILATGEPGLETDTKKVKYGDGVTPWTGLAYANGGITPRSVVGSFMLFGDVPNNSNGDWWFDSVTTDPDGNAYFVGGHFEYNDYTGWGNVVKVNVDGDIQWQKEITWADAWEGAGVSAAFNTVTNQLVVVGQYQLANPGNANQSTAVVIKLDADTGDIADTVTTIRDEVIDDGSDYSWLNIYDIALTSSGDPIVVGSKEGNLQVYNLTTQTGSTVDYLMVDATVFPDGAIPINYNNWYITGTNIANKLWITDVNTYYSIPTVANAGTGTGLTFVISSDGSGGYTINGLNGGTGYAVNNKILILGSSLGGSDGVNDATVTIISTTEGGVPATTSVNGSSTGAQQFQGVSGTNIASGYNFQLNTIWNVKRGQVFSVNGYNETSGFWIQQQGNDYAVGDTVYVNPQEYGGLTSATITITNVGGSGEVYGFTVNSVNYNTSTFKLYTGNSIDYGTEGSWQAWHTDGQAWVWTPAWQRLYGDTSYDNAQAVATDSSGNIYIAGQTYDQSRNQGSTRGVLVKINSTGDLQWSKNFDPEGFDGFDDGYTGVAIDKDDNIIVCHDTVITKINGDGVILWQQWIGYYQPMGTWNACVDVDTDGNIYVNAEYDYMGQNTGDDYLIVKFDTNGNVLWQREAGTTADEDSQWNDSYQTMAVGGGQFYLAGSSYQGNDDVGFAVGFPTDGSGASESYHGRFLYRETNWNITATTTATVQAMPVFFTGTTFLTVATTSTGFDSVASTWTNTTVYLRDGETDGRIENLYSISFEDGSVQTTAYVPGLPPSYDSPRIYNTNNYVLTLDDAGKMTRWYAPGWWWGNSIDIYVPTDEQVPFAIGTQIHFMKDQGFEAFMFWPGVYGDGYNDVTIMPAQPNFDYGMQQYMYNSGEGWSVRHPNWDQVPCIATLTKIDTNRWLLSCNSPSHVMDWNW